MFSVYDCVGDVVCFFVCGVCLFVCLEVRWVEVCDFVLGVGGVSVALELVVEFVYCVVWVEVVGF